MLKVDTLGSIVTVTLDRPDVHNAFNDVLITSLTETFADLANRADVRVILLKANGKSFSAGGDLNWVKRAASYTREENLRDAKAAGQMFLTIARCPKPVIARVHGAAIGGGAGLVAACDMAVAVESAQFGFPEVKLGIIPAIISPFVIARIGGSVAREYFLRGERFSASVARDIGLIRHVVRDEAEMDALIDAWTAEIMTSSPAAIAAAKALIFGVAGRPIESILEFTAEAFSQARASDDGKAGVEAFLSRAKPPWVPR